MILPFCDTSNGSVPTSFDSAIRNTFENSFLTCRSLFTAFMEVSKVRRIPASSSNKPPKRNYSEHVSRVSTQLEDGSCSINICGTRAGNVVTMISRENTSLTTGRINTIKLLTSLENTLRVQLVVPQNLYTLYSFFFSSLSPMWTFLGNPRTQGRKISGRYLTSIL